MIDDTVKDYWDKAYRHDDVKMTDDGVPTSNLQRRRTRNGYMAQDFLNHVVKRPKRLIKETFRDATSVVEVGCGTGEFIAYLFHRTPLLEGWELIYLWMQFELLALFRYQRETHRMARR